MENPGTVHAVQVNYNDFKSNLFGKPDGLYHRYVVEGSLDGKEWQVLVDRSHNYTDVPNDYVELGVPEKVRYIRYRNIHVPTPYLSISGLRVFGIGEGDTPSAVTDVTVECNFDRREV